MNQIRRVVVIGCSGCGALAALTIKKLKPSFEVTIIRVIYTSIKERGIAHYLSWIEEYILEVREDIRMGKRIEALKLICTPM